MAAGAARTAGTRTPSTSAALAVTTEPSHPAGERCDSEEPATRLEPELRTRFSVNRPMIRLHPPGTVRADARALPGRWARAVGDAPARVVARTRRARVARLGSRLKQMMVACSTMPRPSGRRKRRFRSSSACTCRWCGDADLGRREGVANERPAHPNDPADSAYRWARYDRSSKTRVAPASRSCSRSSARRIGRTAVRVSALRRSRRCRCANSPTPLLFATAGRFSMRQAARIPPRSFRGEPLAAWNEPNNSVFLQPQFMQVNGRCSSRRRRVRSHLQRGLQAVCTPGRAGAVACGATGAARYTTRTPAPPPRRRSRSFEPRGRPGYVGSTPGRIIRTTRSREKRRPAERPHDRLRGPRQAIGVLTQLYGSKPL